MKTSRCLPLLIAAVGCGDSSPQPKVVGTSVTHCVEGTTQPGDFAQRALGAFVLDAGTPSTFRFRAVDSHPDGTFEIDGVPEGSRYLILSGNDIYETDQRVIDASFDSKTRCSPQATSFSAVAELALTQMTPFVDGDEITAASLALTDFEEIGEPLFAGETAVHDLINWFGPLPDASLGDDVTILHTHRDAAATGTAAHLVDVYTASNVTLADHATARVSGSFTPVPSTLLSLSFDATPYVAPYPAASAAASQIEIEVHAGPHTADRFLSATLGDRRIPADPTQLAVAEQVAYGDPFPASWQRSITISGALSRPYQIDSTAPLGFRIGGSQTVAYAGTGAPSFLPMLPPPTGLEINGVDVSEAHGFPIDPTPITLAWQPSGGATNYQLEIWHFASPPTSFSEAPLTVHTAATKITLPSALFGNGGFYVVTLAAQDDLPDLVHGRIFATGDALRSATIASGRLRFAATCGNGVVEAGEDCDDKGESATCNADCTPAVCGDGVLNQAGGEACDTIDDTTACHAATCTLASPGETDLQPAAPQVHTPAETPELTRRHTGDLAHGKAPLDRALRRAAGLRR